MSPLTSHGNLSPLDTLQADLEDVPDQNDIEAIVTSMLGRDTGLRNALELKQDVASAYSDTDTADAVTALINSVGNPLRSKLDTIDGRIVELEAVVDEDCGRHCRAGEYVTAPCTHNGSETVKTVCSSCPANMWSLGGLPTACISCKT